MPTAKVLTNGGEQTVRLPAEVRLEGDEVEVRRDPSHHRRGHRERPERTSAVGIPAVVDDEHGDLRKAASQHVFQLPDMLGCGVVDEDDLNP